MRPNPGPSMDDYKPRPNPGQRRFDSVTWLTGEDFPLGMVRRGKGWVHKENAYELLRTLNCTCARWSILLDDLEAVWRGPRDKYRVGAPDKPEVGKQDNFGATGILVLDDPQRRKIR